MKKSTVISTVDIVAFIAFVLLIATGFLIRYVLPPGSGGLGHMGGGWRAAQRPVAMVWGLTRHEWGTIHFWLSVTFLVAIAVHLFIHWKWIRVSFKGETRVATLMQVGLGIVALIALLALATAPFLAEKVKVPRGELMEQPRPIPSGPRAQR